VDLKDQGLNVDNLPDNVVAFPGARRSRPAAYPATGFGHPSPRCNQGAAAISGAELNARLLLLLGICTTSAAIALSAVHVLQG
jgi:hypothetical protein